MADDEIERLSYYDGQRLGAKDFRDAQAYHRDADRRHLLGAHTWGVVAGLELNQEASADGNGLRVTLMPGLAIDGYGRSIVAFRPYDLPLTLIEGLASGRHPVWLAYHEQAQDLRADPCSGTKANRTRESYRVVIGQRIERRDDIQIGDRALPAAASDEWIPPDESVPHQRFPADERAQWLVRIGTVAVSGDAPRVFVPWEMSLHERLPRDLAGLVGASLLAPEGTLALRRRSATRLDVELYGDLHVLPSPAAPLVGGHGVFHRSVELRAAPIRFRAAGDPARPTQPPVGPDPHLTIEMGAEGEDKRHVDVHLGNTGDGNHCFRVGPAPLADGHAVIKPVFTVCNGGLATLHGPLTVRELTVEGGATVAGDLTVGGTLRARSFEMPDAIDADLARLDLNLRQTLVTNVRLTPQEAFVDVPEDTALTTAFERARQAIYVEVHFTAKGTPNFSGIFSLRSRDQGAREMRFELALGSADRPFENDSTHFIWLAKPANTGTAFQYSLGPFLTARSSLTSFTLSITLLGVL